MALIRSAFWFAIFLAATFTFTVFFEHGFSNFSVNAQKEFEALSQLAANLTSGTPGKAK